MKKYMLAALVLFLSVQWPARASESAFQDASAYTVEIRTVIETAFVPDEYGAQSGAGFLIDRERGWILTNAHVVGSSPSTVRAAFKNHEFTPVEKLYVDPFLDVAVVTLSPELLPEGTGEALPECDEIPSVGHPVGAFGHPWSLRFTGTRGIISGTTSYDEVEWLQTDTPLNPGNSGGPLISLKTGRVVGISAAILDKSETENLNFAVPMVYVCRILELLRQEQDPSPPILPVVFANRAEELGGLMVAAAYFQPGDTLAEGDVILGLGGQQGIIRNETQLLHRLRGLRGSIEILIERGPQRRLVTVSLSPRPRVLERRGVSFSQTLIAAAPLRDSLEFGPGDTLMIHSVDEGETPCTANLGPWQYITSVDGRRFNDIVAFYDYLSGLEQAGRSVTLIVREAAFLPDRLFEYYACTLPVENLHFVGNQ